MMNSERHLHIICLDVPYPVDYGGVFDLFYKIKALSEAGIKIHLHCFEYGRGRQLELNKYCAEVIYYARHKAPKGFSFGVPYIVGSRANKLLLENLQKDDYPILMEGMHCTYFLHTGDLPGTRCFVRLHNVEYEYYHQLAETSNSFFKKIYYNYESNALRKYEGSLANKANFWSVTDKDRDTMIREFGYSSIDFLPLFLPEYNPQWYSADNGSYCLYHGNLSVPENEEAAKWLVEEVFDDLDIPLVIAGKKPSPALEELVHKRQHTCIVANPAEAEMQDLIKKAQLHILPSMNSTGIKLKLVNALYNGRHCLANNAGVEGTGLEECCMIANSRADMKEAVKEGFLKPFTQEVFTHRMACLDKVFNNSNNARQMIRWIFEGAPTYPGSRR